MNEILDQYDFKRFSIRDSNDKKHKFDEDKKLQHQGIKFGDVSHYPRPAIGGRGSKCIEIESSSLECRAEPKDAMCQLKLYTQKTGKVSLTAIRSILLASN